ncbi:Protein suppressor of hairy wing [Gryllus bimaculatus]|nr:Protein suppressor of hairy wing [Gryllus bimaculatus]
MTEEQAIMKQEEILVPEDPNKGYSADVKQETPNESLNSSNEKEECDQPMRILLPEIKVEVPDVEEEETVVGRGEVVSEDSDMKNEGGGEADIQVKKEQEVMEEVDDTGGGSVSDVTRSSATQKEASTEAEYITPDDPSGQEGLWRSGGGNGASANDVVRTASPVAEDPEKPFSCATCGAAFRHRSNMLRHQLTHGAQKPFGCELCGKRFTQSGNLKHCGKGFARASKLSAHRPVHTGERPFACGVCGATFGNSTLMRVNLRTHERSHAPPSERAHACAECGQRFALRRTCERTLAPAQQRPRTLRDDADGASSEGVPPRAEAPRRQRGGRRRRRRGRRQEDNDEEVDGTDDDRDEEQTVAVDPLASPGESPKNSPNRPLAPAAASPVGAGLP